MKRSLVETLLGALVLGFAAFFLMFSMRMANVSQNDGYEIVADFANIGGLQAGDDVQIAGVSVGRVNAVTIVPESFKARVHLIIDSQYKLPSDTAAIISSESLLGGRFLSLEPGADEVMLNPGDQIMFTQAPQNLEQLLGKFIFSAQNDKKDEAQDAAPSSAPLPENP